MLLFNNTFQLVKFCFSNPAAPENTIKLIFVDESNIPNISISEPNIVTNTGKSITVSENNMNEINNEKKSKNLLQKRKHEKIPVAPSVRLTHPS